MFLHGVNMAALCALLLVGLAIFWPSLGFKSTLGISFAFSFIVWILSVHSDIEAWERGERTVAESLEMFIRASSKSGFLTDKE